MRGQQLGNDAGHGVGSIGGAQVLNSKCHAVAIDIAGLFHATTNAIEPLCCEHLRPQRAHFRQQASC